MIINCIIIEDEPLALKKIKEFVTRVDYLNLLASFCNAIEALVYLKNNSVDLIFLDIRMKRLSGIQLLESLQNRPKIIITSAYDEYALKGYELDVTDYLLKPFTFARFIKSVEKIYSQLAESKSIINNNYIFIKTEYRIEKIELNDILYIQGMKDYLQIITLNKKIMTLQTFKNLMDLLPERDFQRVHNSFIIALSKIKSIERNRIRIGDELIPISDGYKNKFYELLEDRKIYYKTGH
ncbi:MAG: response regulator transcription factor [Ignavibacteriales bacterium]|nr:response regulator transcription factor [Ignavibacteriales bacterium]